MSWSEYWGEKNWLAEARSDNESPAIDDWREGERDWKQRSVACKLDFLLYLLNAKNHFNNNKICNTMNIYTSNNTIFEKIGNNLQYMQTKCLTGYSFTLYNSVTLSNTAARSLRHFSSSAKICRIFETCVHNNWARSLYFQSFLELLSTWILCFSTSFPYPRSWYSSINFE